jgi:hypothetical protein
MTQWSTIFRYGSDSDVEASSGRGSLYPHKRTSTACRIIKPEIVVACTAAARRTHRGAAMPKAGRTGAISGLRAAVAEHHSIAVSRDAVLISLHPLQRKTRSAVLVAVAGSLPTYAVGTPQTSHLGGDATGGG